jgi:protein involved in polysaccharide export with SLBB domain
MHLSLLSKLKSVRFLCFPLLLASILLTLGLAGCSTTDYKDVMSPPDQGGSPPVLPRIAVGDTLIITLSGIPGGEPPYEKPITDDGTITLPDIGRIQAAGKTPGELEVLIHDQYVPRLYTHLGVTVKTAADNQVYFVRGEVKSPGRLIYVGPTTVSKAITSAGDFTDFANRSKVFLTRSNGKRFRLNCDKILEGKAPDPPVYPGDQIEVKRRLI